MINTKHLLLVASSWMSIVYAVCYAGVAIYPDIRILFMKYALHGTYTASQNYLSIGYFISGLIIWNIIAVLGVWLFALLFNTIKQ